VPIRDQIYPLHVVDFCKTSFCKPGINASNANVNADSGDGALESQIFMGAFCRREKNLRRFGTSTGTSTDDTEMSTFRRMTYVLANLMAPGGTKYTLIKRTDFEMNSELSVIQP
jgi:hypothetical protein